MVRRKFCVSSTISSTESDISSWISSLNSSFRKVFLLDISLFFHVTYFLCNAQLCTTCSAIFFDLLIVCYYVFTADYLKWLDFIANKVFFDFGFKFALEHKVLY